MESGRSKSKEVAPEAVEAAPPVEAVEAVTRGSLALHYGRFILIATCPGGRWSALHTSLETAGETDSSELPRRERRDAESPPP
jgi:hypothetical protein